MCGGGIMIMVSLTIGDEIGECFNCNHCPVDVIVIAVAVHVTRRCQAKLTSAAVAIHKQSHTVNFLHAQRTTHTKAGCAGL